MSSWRPIRPSTRAIASAHVLARPRQPRGEQLHRLLRDAGLAAAGARERRERLGERGDLFLALEVALRAPPPRAAARAAAARRRGGAAPIARTAAVRSSGSLSSRAPSRRVALRSPRRRPNSVQASRRARPSRSSQCASIARSATAPSCSSVPRATSASASSRPASRIGTTPRSAAEQTQELHQHEPRRERRLRESLDGDLHHRGRSRGGLANLRHQALRRALHPRARARAAAPASPPRAWCASPSPAP